MIAFQHAVNVIAIMFCETICVKENNYDPFSVSESACPYLIRKEGRDSLCKGLPDKGYSHPLASSRLLSECELCGQATQTELILFPVTMLI